MNLHVISGGPCTGKTAVLNELKKEGFYVIEEAARKVGENRVYPSIEVFQRAIFEYQRQSIEGVKNEKIVFTDRWIGDTISYYQFHSLGVPEDILDYANKVRPIRVFIMEPFIVYEKDGFRNESQEQQKKIHEIIIETYKEMGSEIIKVPLMGLVERVEFIK